MRNSVRIWVSEVNKAECRVKLRAIYISPSCLVSSSQNLFCPWFSNVFSKKFTFKSRISLTFRCIRCLTITLDHHKWFNKCRNYPHKLFPLRFLRLSSVLCHCPVVQETKRLLPSKYLKTCLLKQWINGYLFLVERRAGIRDQINHSDQEIFPLPKTIKFNVAGESAFGLG